MNQSFDTFIFDLDGTLLDTLADLVVLTNKALQEQGFPQRSIDDIHGAVGGGLQVLMKKMAPSGTSDAEIDILMKRWQSLYPKYGIVQSTIYPGVFDLITALKARGKQLGVLSNKFDGGVHDLISRFFPDMFSVCRGVQEGIPRKPDPRGLLTVMEEMGIDLNGASSDVSRDTSGGNELRSGLPHNDGVSSTRVARDRVVYVGDSPTDVLTAQNAGIQVISVTWGYRSKEELYEVNPSGLVNSPEEILQFA